MLRKDRRSLQLQWKGSYEGAQGLGPVWGLEAQGAFRGQGCVPGSSHPFVLSSRHGVSHLLRVTPHFTSAPASSGDQLAFPTLHLSIGDYTPPGSRRTQHVPRNLALCSGFELLLLLLRRLLLRGSV